MGRSGYIEDCGDYDDDNRSLLWRGAVKSAMRGKRGQAFLKELLAAMDALPAKRLVAGDFEAPETGMPFALRRDVCALGAVGRARGVDMQKGEFAYGEDANAENIAGEFGIAHALASEIMYANDEGSYRETPEARFERMRKWVADQIVSEQPPKR